MEKVKCVIYGVGAIGRMLSKALLEKDGFEIVGAVDVDPNKVGKDLGEVLGLNRKLGVVISKDADKVLEETKPNVVFHMTSSFLSKVFDQLMGIVKHGVNVVSSCEELSYPYISNFKLALELDKAAKKHGATILGTGINPGFLMDTLVITLTSPCLKINSIKVTRQMNASTRRGPFQKKIGAGLSVEEFENKIKSGIISGHVGLEQSISLIADALKVKLDKIVVEPVKPVISDKYVKTDFVEVNPGMVAGLNQTARGIVSDRDFITLIFTAYVGAPEEYDAIDIDGIPEIHQRISPCVHGDWGTISMLINMAPKAIESPPGLLTMKDITVPHCVLSDVREYLKH
ncbi:MAG: hypothetical protein DRJ30_01365 [Candidatus Methanomethylicota archaeon]|nr:MAG: hypothetical protein DRJ30_01365 [Candidatus Verstraetearchaeota archaeon]